MIQFIEQNDLRGENLKKDRWIDIAFPVAVASIVTAIILPGALVRLTEKFHVSISPFHKIVLSVFTVQLIFLIPLLFVAVFCFTDVKLKEKFDLINWRFDYFIQAFCWEIVLFIPLWIIAVLMYFFVSFFGLDVSSPITKLLLSASGKGKLLIFFVSVFLAPVVEELVFRRVIFTFINKLFGVLPALLLTSFAFGALHGGFVQLVPLTLLAIVLQILYLKHKSLYPSILLHAIHNFFIMLIFLALGV